MNPAVLDRYEPVIGLEVHAQLSTATKMFTAVPYRFGVEPNTLIDPVVLGLPGTLPVVNHEAVAFAVKLALAVGGRIRNVSRFARKHYFYPDLPKGYQISQYDEPYCEGGVIEFELADGTRRTVELTRIHMEEDSGKNMHADDGANFSLVDFNRAGVPLVEIVSEPVMHSAAEAVAYLKALRQILRTLGICDGNLEEGSMRCDANVSIRLRGTTKLGTRTEMKNLNSFKAVSDAIEYEIERQAAVLDDGRGVMQATLLWDPAHGQTKVLRTKEEAEDYRYFPEPDLPPLAIPAEWIESLRGQVPELPLALKDRLISQHQLTPYDAEIFMNNLEVAHYFESCVNLADQPGLAKKVANWILTELMGTFRDTGRIPVRACDLAALVLLVEGGELTGRNAKDIFARLLAGEQNPRELAANLGLLGSVAADGELETLCRRLIDDNPAQVEKYRKGKTNVMGFFVGEVMKATRGKADAAAVTELLKTLLK
ncbi:Asp-tRNA(Asn)/Glu-tRNA(Gln) amidotransferase subunit GatB [Myxococcota bacterium]|nr:Asp-tRNA(Asn)/Glu-tRNA(Gln) amidotransferase subunit GatB [Myxococcota bacterium]MBU1508785.1 Asp-tRNA(Asn)/Glu-tRNA(Gln) amidotransferase subunit GatB [Myxococcota bacterium]